MYDGWLQGILSSIRRVDLGDRIVNRAPKEKQRQIVPQSNTNYLRFCACTKPLSM